MPMATKRTARNESERRAALDALEAWADAPSTADYDEVLHNVAGVFLLKALSRPTQPLDAFVIPMV